jgi:hypothetical protein
MTTEKVESPYFVFQNWLFDGNPKSKVPSGVGVPDLLSYKSPITPQYMITLFLNNGKLNCFLNEYFNNVGLYYMDKEELMRFVKKCIFDFKIQRKSLPFIPREKNGKLFDSLKKKIPILKKHDISLLCQLIDKSEEKENVYYSLGLEKPETIKKQKGLKKSTKKDKETVKDFLKNNFKIMEIEKS